VQPEVREWFERRTSALATWTVQRVLADKQACGARVSVVLPALNEEATVGQIVTALHSTWVERTGLVDELVVVDSGSTDGTAAAAAAAGARVLSREQILPRLVPVAGKGEVLWRSLHATTGDIVVFVDADLERFNPQILLGLLGPLFADEDVALVKGMYDRPLRNHQTVLPAGGGRVTELVARPLLNLHWPELAGVVQPLAGEYAARRSLLEQLPFPCGYGVEVAMLIDTLTVAGLDAIAQVDLGARHHRHQDDAALGRMSTEICQAVLTRVGREAPPRGRIFPPAELTQFARVDGRVEAQTSQVTVRERPPMRTIPEYLAHRDAEPERVRSA
jgi:glucosyl-3-phosphoglycerate synthase